MTLSPPTDDQGLEPAPILIDLRTALTDEVIAEAMPHVGDCRYSAPCIIGAMIPADRRALLDVRGFNGGGPAVSTLIEDRFIGFAPGQLSLAILLQEAFDNYPDEFPDVLASVRRQLAGQVA